MTKTRRNNPHEGRAAEIYLKQDGKLVFQGYSGVPLFETASWNSELQAWVLHDHTADGQNRS